MTFPRPYAGSGPRRIHGSLAGSCGDDTAVARRHWRDALRLLDGYRDARAVELRERVQGELGSQR
ncbi:hypothetical protein [Streptomyces coffeae]|uniref:Bacterial transcriptional activator domain-containing protein n=1 Tax=Streptomyces coffeae TaxID=621382 RepID=A0ABS1N5S7_9ACTN|nr:hypothetical protein [Streptomyces coffeae]MBL1095436.1 hypothetical protein [Streptomyces coffeae]